MINLLRQAKRHFISETSFLTLLIVLLLTVFVLPSMIENDRDSVLFLNLCFVLLFFVGVFSADKGIYRIISISLLVAHIILKMIRFGDNPYEFYLEERVVILLNLIIFIILNFRLLFVDSRVSLYRVIGAVNVYLLLALAGAIGFEIIQLTIGQSIGGSVEFVGNERDFSYFMYFSLVCITTVGFGDIFPITVPAKMLSVFLSASGVLYPAIVIAKLVASSGTPKK